MPKAVKILTAHNGAVSILSDKGSYIIHCSNGKKEEIVKERKIGIEGALIAFSIPISYSTNGDENYERDGNYIVY